MDAFDSRKVADPGHLTVKYKFAKVAKQYSLESVTDKTKAEELLKQMKADLTATGLNVLDISKDKIKIKDDAGQEVWLRRDPRRRLGPRPRLAVLRHAFLTGAACRSPRHTARAGPLAGSARAPSVYFQQC